MPTAVSVIVPQVRFHSCGNLFPTRVTSAKYGRNAHAGSIWDSFAPPTSIVARSWTCAALMSALSSWMLRRSAALTMQGRTAVPSPTSRSIQVSTSTSSNMMRCRLPFLISRGDLEPADPHVPIDADETLGVSDRGRKVSCGGFGWNDPWLAHRVRAALVDDRGGSARAQVPQPIRARPVDDADHESVFCRRGPDRRLVRPPGRPTPVPDHRRVRTRRARGSHLQAIADRVMERTGPPPHARALRPHSEHVDHHGAEERREQHRRNGQDDPRQRTGGHLASLSQSVDRATRAARR